MSTKFNLEGSQNINDLYSNVSQYFVSLLSELDADDLIFLRNDASELIGELEGLIQRAEKEEGKS